ncbi:hypothetical protein AzCIB_1190 [Azoarcus sp. CIB]|nr:hypothetical protein AzCIB_1190 [Azoarcus sp. CIB]
MPVHGGHARHDPAGHHAHTRAAGVLERGPVEGLAVDETLPIGTRVRTVPRHAALRWRSEAPHGPGEAGLVQGPKHPCGDPLHRGKAARLANQQHLLPRTPQADGNRDSGRAGA